MATHEEVNKYANNDEEPDEDTSIGDEDYDDDGDGDGDGDEAEAEQEPAVSQRQKIDAVLRRLSSGPVLLHVHDFVILGNSKTKNALIEAEVLQAFRSATSMQELLKASNAADARLRRLEIFDSVSITLYSGSQDFPGTANVIINVVETKNPITGDLGVISKPEARTWSLEGSLKFKNLFGYGDIWDTSLVYGWDQSSQ